MGENTALPLDEAAIDRLVRQRVDAILDAELGRRLRAAREAATPSMTIIATKGTLDWAYPPFILASTAGALGWNVSVFFTFYGLELLKKDLSHLQVSPLGNPAMPMKMPFGPDWFRSIRWNVPNAMQSIVPGFEAFATSMMRRTIAGKGVAPVEELRQACLEADVRLVGCQMTVDLFGYSPADFIPEVAEYCGAATFLPMARDADVSLFI